MAEEQPDPALALWGRPSWSSIGYAQRLAALNLLLLGLLGVNLAWRALAPRLVHPQATALICAQPTACQVRGRVTLACGAQAQGCDASLPAIALLGLGRPIDVNHAPPEALGLVPGLSRRLAAQLVASRQVAGPFASLDQLRRVRGLGPKRLARARPHLEIRAAPGGTPPTKDGSLGP